MRRGDNPQYQLTRAEYPAGAPFNGAVDQWTYDSIGNRTSANQNGTPLTYQYQQNTNNPLNGQLLNTDGVNTYTYDAAGNMATQTGPSGTYTYQYDAENRLKAILTSGSNAYYTYDFQGRRTSKTVAGVTSTYLYDGVNLVSDITNGFTTSYLFGPGIDEPLALQRFGETHYLTVDGLGSVVGEADPSGAMVHASIFDVWGVQKTESGTRLSIFGYTGREFGEGGLWFYRARFYQSETGRFTQEDPLAFFGSFPNVYAYVRSDPAGAIDPSGLVDLKLIDPYRFPAKGPKSATQNALDRILFESFDKVLSEEGEFTVGAHGTWAGTLVAYHRELTARELADMIRASKGWKPGMRVKLYACNTGWDPSLSKRGQGRKTPFAQELADELGVDVTAPDYLIGPRKDGSIKMYDGAIWVPFSPRRP